MEKLIKGLPVKEYKRQWKLNNPEKVKASRDNRKEQKKVYNKAYYQRKKLEEQKNKKEL